MIRKLAWKFSRKYNFFVCVEKNVVCTYIYIYKDARTSTRLWSSSLPG